MLLQSFLTHKIGLLHLVALAVLEGQTILRQLVVLAELLVIAVSVGVVQRGRRRPMVVNVPCCRQYIMVLPEIVRRLVPETAVGHLIACRLVVTVGIFYKQAVVACH